MIQQDKWHWVDFQRVDLTAPDFEPLHLLLTNAHLEGNYLNVEVHAWSNDQRLEYGKMYNLEFVARLGHSYEIRDQYPVILSGINSPSHSLIELVFEVVDYV